MRLPHVLGCGGLLLCLIPACSDDNKNNPPDDTGGEGGGGGSAGSGGKSTAGGNSVAGKAGGGAGGRGGSGGGQPSNPTAGADAGGMNAGGEAGMSGAGGDPNPVDCSKLAKAPASFEVLRGFTSSEDFAFDADGNYVGVDESNNLVRISKEGKKELWAPAIGGTAGMGMLPDGSIVICDVVNGALKRVYANGGSEVVIGGLLYPNGMDIGPDGFIYVAENSAGRVRRVNPDNGAFTIVAMGLHGPNGVAFSNDPKLLYVGSFEGSGVYKVEIPAPGELGKSSVFARPNGSTLAEPELACPDQIVGKACVTTTGGAEGKCQQLSNVVDCVPANPCDGLKEGDDCAQGTGTCQSGQCISKDPCAQNPNSPGCQGSPCDGLKPGDKCEDPWSGPGTCQDIGGEALYCVPPNPCDGKKDGEVCEGLGSAGECQGGHCEPVQCAGSKVGDPCWTGGHGGTCQGEPDALECINQCAGKPDDTACKLADVDGKCTFEECVLVQCTKDTLGQECVNGEDVGYCTEVDGKFVCQVGGGSGGIDGLGVDACGNVYASEYTVGNLWRISPAGDIELLAKLPSSWVPNIKWGRGVGGFERDIMFVADRDEGRLFAVSVGVPSATEYYDLGAK